MPPSRTDSSQLQTFGRALKFVAIALGLPGSLLTFMALVGGVVANGWVRVGVALVLVIVVPLFIADRLLDKDAGKQKAGLVTDVVALYWLGAVVIASGALSEGTRGLYATEGDRLVIAGFPSLGSVAYFLGGVAMTPAPTPGVTTRATTSASSSAAPATSAASSAAPPASSSSARPDAGAP